MLTMRKIYWPSINILGPGSLKEAASEIKKMNLGRALIVTDKVLCENGVVEKVLQELKNENLDYVLYNDVNQNPTTKNVNDGLDIYKKNNCNYIISIGGGSPQDTAKAIGILVTNGGNIVDYEGIFKSKNKSVPIVAINTTAGTASEVTINYVITDENRKIKMVMVDPNSLATIAVNDPELMLKKPASLTAATGMDALTHAIEAYVTKGSYELSDTLALEAIKLIGESLEEAVKTGDSLEARSKMAWGSYIAGLSFSNCGLGIVHSLAHQLGSEYDIPHGVANAILLADVMEYNLDSNYKKFADIARVLGRDVENKCLEKAALESVLAVRELSEKVNIPKLNETKFRIEDVEKLSKQAHEDVCAGGNPKDASIQDIVDIYTRVYSR
ncbi:MAG: iron-containing alcohol dehydrogenase [Cetobacterium sp.]|uniref:iron-containing alcohol dehydrogenase n=1 Tax=Cetobacterium sp. TaxID=2071632 RepID=UPI002FC6E7C5